MSVERTMPMEEMAGTKKMNCDVCVYEGGQRAHGQRERERGEGGVASLLHGGARVMHSTVGHRRASSMVLPSRVRECTGPGTLVSTPVA